MQPVRRQTLIAQVTERLRNEIVSGRWAVGTRIPTEPELCQLTGTARNTVREAVQALVHSGMLERRQGSGTYVLSTGHNAALLTDYFAAAKDRDLLELREALDVTAAGLAAQRRDDEDIEALQKLLARRNELWSAEQVAPELIEEAIAVDVAVHRGIVAASHNEVYLEVYDSLLGLMEHNMRGRPVGSECSYEREHTALVEGVIGGDAEAAKSAAQDLMTELIMHRHGVQGS